MNDNSESNKQFQRLADALRKYQEEHPTREIVINEGLEWMTARGVQEHAESKVGKGEDLMGRYYQYLDKKYGEAFKPVMQVSTSEK